jgi:hypothetical protein
MAPTVPLVRLAAWPYPYHAAFKTRHDHFLHKEASDLEAKHGPRLWETNPDLYDWIAKVEPSQLWTQERPRLLLLGGVLAASVLLVALQSAIKQQALFGNFPRAAQFGYDVETVARLGHFIEPGNSNRHARSRFLDQPAEIIVHLPNPAIGGPAQENVAAPLEIARGGVREGLLLEAAE